MKTLSTFIFKKMVSLAYAEDSSIECIGMKSNFGVYEMNFYAWQSNNYALRVDEFGYQEGTNWVQCKPTIEQMATMEDLLTKELKHQQDIEDNKLLAKLEQEQFEKDCYRYGEVGF